LTQGTLIGWTVFIDAMLGSIFLGAPLWWDEVNTGYAYTGPLVGAILGFLVAGSLADWSAKLMTRHNNGIYEPEFRIVLVIPRLVIGSAGLFGFGIVSPNMVEYFWFWPVFFFGMVVMGMVIGAVASALYIVDAHRMFPGCLLPFSHTDKQNR
jgi:MFS family permease